MAIGMSIPGLSAAGSTLGLGESEEERKKRLAAMAATTAIVGCAGEGFRRRIEPGWSKLVRVVIHDSELSRHRRPSGA
jgi:hypothetical protein